MIKIRYGTTQDAKLLSEIGARTFFDSFAGDNTAENTALYLKNSFSVEIQSAQLADRKVVFLIAELDEAPVGYVQLNLYIDHDSQENPKTLEIQRIYAEKEYIGRGVGGELMKACIDEARQRGCERIWLGVWENNPRGIAFYRKWGFKEIGTHTFMLGDDPQRDFIMQLILEQA